MSDMVRCDGCQKVVTEQEAVTWFAIQHREVKQWGEPDAWHFCSWDCLGAFALAQDEIIKGKVPGVSPDTAGMVTYRVNDESRGWRRIPWPKPS